MEEQNEELYMNSNQHEMVKDFGDLNLNNSLLRGIYSFGIERPLNIQKLSIKPMLLGKNIIAQSQPLSGKTFSFIIGMLGNIDYSLNKCQALILAPTRIIAQLIHKLIILEIGKYTNINCHACIGGSDVRKEIEILKKGVQAVVGTPGRVLHMISRGFLSMSNLKTLILDEADEILTKRFKNQISKIFRFLPGNVQYCLFSATMTNNILKLANDLVNDPIRISLKLSFEGIAQHYYIIEKNDWKFTSLVDLYERTDIAQAIIYINTKEKGELLTNQMIEKEFVVSFVHREMDWAQRELIIQEFNTGSTRTLITSDFLLDRRIKNLVSVFINYDMPKNYQNYAHRIERAYSLSRKQLFITFVTEEDCQILMDFENHYNTTIEELPEDLYNLI